MISNSKRIVKTLMSRLRVVPRLALPMLLKNTNPFISDKGNCLKLRRAVSTAWKLASGAVLRT